VKHFKRAAGAVVALLALIFFGVLSWTTVLVVLVVAAVGYGVYLGLLWLSPSAKDAHDKRAGKRNPVILIVSVIAFAAFGYALDRDLPPAEMLVAWLLSRT
jgi:hypothetical protein